MNGGLSAGHVDRTGVAPSVPFRLSNLKTSRYGYAVAVAAILVALAARAVLPVGLPFITFYPAVILTAYLCGPGPALVSAILSGLAAWSLVLPSNLPVTGACSSAVALGLYAAVVSINILLICLL